MQRVRGIKSARLRRRFKTVLSTIAVGNSLGTSNRPGRPGYRTAFPLDSTSTITTLIRHVDYFRWISVGNPDLVDSVSCPRIKEAPGLVLEKNGNGSGRSNCLLPINVGVLAR